jgi:RNA polymerase sigma factor (sigma-70 family)
MTSDDMALVLEYAERSSEQAFATLVSRHVNLVYSVALRQVRDPHLAEEITQGVFTILAQKAKSLRPKTVLAGWLCRTARYVSANTLRNQRNRRFRERESQMQSISNEPEPGAWNQIEPMLEEALSCLREKEHDAVVLRFFEGKELKQIGAALGTTEDAARMRVNRGVEKLREFFTKRGVTISATAMTGAMAAYSVQAAPVGLATTITAAVLSGTTITTTAIIAATKSIAMTAVHKAAVAAAVAILAGAGVYEARRAARLHEQVQTLKQQQAPLLDIIQQLENEREDGARAMASLHQENEALNRASGELARLRGQVGILRSQLDELKGVGNQHAQQQTESLANQDSALSKPVAKIQVTHIKQPQQVSEEQIRSYISIKAGDVVERAAVDRDVRNLHDTGLFQNVRVAESAEGEGVVLNYLVQEKPTISKIRFSGNTKFAEADLAMLLTSRVDVSLNERALFEDSQKIQELYVKSGLSNTSVKFSSNVNEDVGLAEVTFEITE